MMHGEALDHGSLFTKFDGCRCRDVRLRSNKYMQNQTNTPINWECSVRVGSRALLLFACHVIVGVCSATTTECRAFVLRK